MRSIPSTLALVAAVTTLSGGGCGPLNESYTETASERGISEVRINGGSGNVTVIAADVNEARITRTFHYSGDRPTAGHSVEGGVLVLTLRCGNQCRVDYRVEVPAATKLTGESGSGDVTAEGVSTVDVGAKSGKVTMNNITGAVRVNSKSGDIELTSLSGSVEATASSGGVVGKDLRGSTIVHGSSGGVDLQLTKAVDVQVDAHSGDVTLTVPPTAYRVETNTKSGSVNIGVNNQAGAENLLKVTTRSGDITMTPAAV